MDPVEQDRAHQEAALLQLKIAEAQQHVAQLEARRFPSTMHNILLPLLIVVAGIAGVVVLAGGILLQSRSRPWRAGAIGCGILLLLLGIFLAVIGLMVFA